jgi:ribosomal protein L22
MADETQAGAPTPDDEPAGTEAAAVEPTTPAEETPAEETPVAEEALPETPAVEPVADAPAAETPDPAKARKPAKPAAKPAAAATPAKKPAKKPSRSGLRGRVGTRGRGGKAGAVDRELPVVRAQAKYVRTSARKARLVCDHIRGKSVAEAQAILAFAPRAVAADWAKLLKSAVANAENNHELLGEDLRVKEAFADEGPTLKRFRPRAMGRATPIRKRTSHLTITLTPKE